MSRHASSAVAEDAEELSPRVKRALLVGIAVVAAIAVVSLVVLALTWTNSARENDLRFELAKAAIQTLVVTVLGFTVGAVTFFFQQEYIRAAEDRRHRDQVQREGQIRREDAAEREADLVRQATRVQDDALRSMLDRTIVYYHRLKKLRRMLRARASREISGTFYTDSVGELIDIQLVFEQLAREAPLIDQLDRLREPRLKRQANKKQSHEQFESLKHSFDRIEEYLHGVIKEFETNSASFVDDSPRSTKQLTALAAMIEPHELGGDFRQGVSHAFGDIVNVLLTTLLTPVPKPVPTKETATVTAALRATAPVNEHQRGAE